MRRVLQAAELANAVYDLTVPAGLAIHGIERIKHIPTDTSGMAYLAPYATTIAFAGTASGRDWLTNIKANKRDCFGWFPAHAGFSDCAEAVFEQCLEIAAHSTAPLVLTGHSMGGAVATLVAIGLASKLKDSGRNISLITFGQPRVSKASLIDNAFHGEYIRVANGSDIVPRVPKLGYSHAGQFLYLRNRGGYCVNPGISETMLDRLTAWQHDRITDHSMPAYIRQLQRVIA